MYRLTALSGPGSSGQLPDIGVKDSGGSSSPRTLSVTSKPRRSSRAIVSSPYRPHVLSHKRLSLWKTPYGNQKFNSLSYYFSTELLMKWEQVMESSVEEDIRKNYGAGLLRFTQFCDKFKIPEVHRMPASEELMSLFVTDSGAGKVSGKTISSWLAGLQLWHAVNGAPWLGGNLLKRTTRGASRLAPASSSESPREPVTYEHMLTLRSLLDLSDTKDAAVWAVAAVAFRCCTRLGELLIGSQGSYSLAKHVSRGTHFRRGMSPSGRTFLQFRIPWTKTTYSRGDWIFATSTDDPVNSVTALEHHLVVNAGVPQHAPLFAYETTAGWTCLTRNAFLGRCREVWTSSTFSSPKGHGFRIGGTTFLLLCGVDPWIVMKQGRWSSKAFLTYWRKIETILAMFIPDSLPTLPTIRRAITDIASRT